MSRVAYAIAALVLAGLTVLILVVHSRAAARCDDAGTIGGRETHVVWVDTTHCER